MIVVKIITRKKKLRLFILYQAQNYPITSLILISRNSLGSFGLPFLKALRGVKPNNSNIAISSSNDGFGVVNNFSPAKIELAPAIKQKACSTTLISVRPAERRTTVLGIIM